MGLLDFFKRGKEEDDLDSGLELESLNSSPSTANPFGPSDPNDPFAQDFKPTSKIEEKHYSPQQEYSSNQSGESVNSPRDVELILSKLDHIRSELTNINHRLDNLERNNKKW